MPPRALPRPSTPVIATQRRELLSSYATRTLDTNGVDASNSVRARATATASASTHTKGGYTQIIASTATDANMLWLALTASTLASATDTSTLLDIAIGGAGSETVIVPNLAVGWRTGSVTAPNIYEIPVFIPAGSRVAIRCQSAVTAKTVACQIMLGNLPHSRLAPNAVDAIGANTATSKGVNLAVPGAPNTKGAWTDISASTAQHYSALAVGVQGAGDTTQGNDNALVDVGVSSDGGSTYTVFPGGGDIFVRIANTEAIDSYLPNLIPVSLPAGARVAARYAANTTTSSLDVILYGVPA